MLYPTCNSNIARLNYTNRGNRAATIIISVQPVAAVQNFLTALALVIESALSCLLPGNSATVSPSPGGQTNQPVLVTNYPEVKSRGLTFPVCVEILTHLVDSPDTQLYKIFTEVQLANKRPFQHCTTCSYLPDHESATMF